METAPIIDVPVVIIGGGGVGLSLSCFLSNYKVDYVLFEKHPSTSVLPKAHYLNQRTIEIFRQHGLYDAVTAQSAPLHNMSRVEWRTTLGGDGPFDRRLLSYMNAAGGGPSSPTTEAYRQVSTPTPDLITSVFLSFVFVFLSIHSSNSRNSSKQDLKNMEKRAF